jgi:hypothetical protein
MIHLDHVAVLHQEAVAEAAGFLREGSTARLRSTLTQ